MLEVKALREGAWKMARYTANHTELTMKVSPDLKKLLKLSKYAHPELQAMLIDLNYYKPQYICSKTTVVPASLAFQEDIPDWEGYGSKLMEELYELETKLGKPAILPPRARFKPGPAVHI